ncbi:MAG: SPFH domain-containing protein [Defluviitaleaceae bacterium]|nr:SPFH domain-containing protein [Defluviitaleaceae bacterium]
MSRKVLVDVVKYNGGPDVFAWRFPETELGTWTQLIVNESQEAILFKGGQAQDTFGPGRHTLTTENIPILRNLINLPFGGRSPFTAEVWFINKQHSLDIKWGTPTPIQLKDPMYKIMIPVRAFGQFGIAVEDSRPFITKLVGTLPTFSSQDIINFFRGMYLTKVRTIISQYIAKKEISILEINAYLLELSDDLKESIESRLGDEYGIRLLNFFVNDISIPEDDPGVAQLKAALAKRAEMDIKGFDYTQERSFDTMQKAAANPGKVVGGMMGMGMGLGMGNVMGQGMADMSQNIQVKRTKNCGKCNHTMDEIVRFCGSCGHDTHAVPVIAVPDSVVKFITCECGHSYPEGYKFCPKCGAMAPVPNTCVSCNEALKEGARFCHHCGASQEVKIHKNCPNCSAECGLDAKFCMSCGTGLE